MTDFCLHLNIKLSINRKYLQVNYILYIFSNILIDNTILMSYVHIFDSIYYKHIAL